MARRRKKKTLWITLPVWAAAAALVLWGLWQAAQFRRTMIAGAAPSTAETPVAAPADSQPQPDDASDNAAADQADEWTNAQIPGHDEWLAAMTPVDDPSDSGPATAPSVTEDSTADNLLTRASALLDAGDAVGGRAALNAALTALGEDPRSATVRQQLAAINDSVFLGTAIMPEDPASRFVEIQPGDSFLKLGQKFAVPAAFLESVNPGINPRNLKPMMGVKIVEGPFHLRMNKSARRIDLFARDMFVRSFLAQVLEGDYLPRGTYRVSNGSKIQVADRQWIGIEGLSDGTRAVSLGWLYGQAGPRKCRSAGVADRISGVKLQDEDLRQIYNVVVEGRSLLRVEP